MNAAATQAPGRFRLKVLAWIFLAALSALVAARWRLRRPSPAPLAATLPATASPGANSSGAPASELEESFAALAATDPIRALQTADVLAGPRRTTALLGALRVLVVESPDLAFAAVDAYGDDPPSRAALLQGLLARWYQIDGYDAMQRYFLQHPPSDRFDPVYVELASTMVRANPTEAGAWLIKISRPALREQATLAAIAQLQEAHPEIAARLIVDLRDTLPERTPESLTLQRLERPLASWARRDRPAAFSYLYSLGGLTSSGRNSLLQKLGLADSR